MAPPDHIAEHVAAWAEPAEAPAGEDVYDVPSFFQRKEVEHRLRSAKARAEELLGQLTSSERTLRAVLDRVEGALLQVDLDGTILAANQRTWDVYGVDPAALVGASFLDDLVRPGADPAELAAAWDQAVDGVPTAFVTVQHRAPDGAPFDAEIHLRRVDLGDGERVLADLRDVTERRKVERMKDELISVVSHELRTPLTSVHGAIGMLLGGVPTEVPDEAQRVLQVAYRNTRRLIRILGDILDLERLASDRLPVDVGSHDVGVLVEEATEANRPFALRFGVVLDVDVAPRVPPALVDAERLRQVLDNLLSNAVKFSPPDGRVSIRVLQPPGEDVVRVEVEDRGEGIPEDFHDRLFEPFEQADSSTARRRYGAGLGLSIAKRLLEAMHGRLDFRSEPGEGTTFVVDLPAVAGSG
jgi:PAS domain S-box-containing protein